jgi:uncharacterized protein involved in exopolysaccharide biosynthesis
MTPPTGSQPEASELEPAWAPALSELAASTWRWRWRLLACGVVAAGFGMGLRLAYPGNYAATEQLLFDPQGLKVFETDASSARFDANAQIDFVESQMGVLMSERVLARVLLRECPPAAEPPKSFQRLCSDAPARAIDGLRKIYSVKRGERSFLVDVMAVADAPDFAARLAADLTESYIAEDASSRAATAAKLGAEIDARIAALRQSLDASEKQAETYRRDEDLTKIGDKLLIELKLNDAANGLDAAEGRLEIARARMTQLEATRPDETGLGALGSENETKPLALLLEKRAEARADLAPLASRMGARNPELIQAQSRLTAVERDVARELASIRAGARAALARAEHEHTAFARTAEQLTSELSHAREAQIALAALDSTVAANRKLIETLENRSREVAETGKLDLANLRVASKARAAAPRNLLKGLIAYGAAGFLGGLALAVGLTAVLVAMRAGRKTPAPADLLRETARRLRA